MIDALMLASLMLQLVQVKLISTPLLLLGSLIYNNTLLFTSWNGNTQVKYNYLKIVLSST